MSQRHAFLDGEGDAWFQRNSPPEQGAPPMWAVAPLVGFIDEASTILEVGCSDGRNLTWLREQTGCSAAGVDPSSVAIATGSDRYPDLDLRVGTADQLPFEQRFDLVLLGFCLYLCDREDLPRIVAEVDRVLEPGGCLAIIDFDPPTPRRRRYRHREGVSSFKMDHMSIFTAFPNYSAADKFVGSHTGPGWTDDASERIALSIAIKERSIDQLEEAD
jgi:SAM-dependent methyltransferase